jgi:hypothetical protein
MLHYVCYYRKHGAVFYPSVGWRSLMTPAQQKLLDTLELAVAHLSFNGEKELAAALAPVCEWLDKGEPVIAVLEGEALGLDQSTLQCIRETFEVLDWQH